MPEEPSANPGYIMLNPTRQYKRSPMVITKKFLNKIFIVFFCLVSPISRKENPRCIKNTRPVQTIIHTLLAVNKVVSIF
jgi:hypothetical protein